MALPEPDIDDLKAQYPTWNLVDAIRDPISGGVWALGADGGVFALDGAPFLGSAAGQGYFAGRNAVRIEADARGGYRLLSQNSEIYDYPNAGYQAPGGAPGTDVGGGTTTPGAPAPPAVDAAKVGLDALLGQMGLTTLAEKAWTFWTSMGATATMEAVNVWIRDQPEFDARFPGMNYLESKGKYWTPAQYITYEQGVNEAMSRAGIPKGFWDDPTDYATLLQNDWSLDEVTDAVGEAENAVLNLPPSVLAQMKTWGLTNGDMTAFWLNPDKGLTLAERKAATQAAQVGTFAPRGITGALTQAEATGIVQQVGVEAAGRGFEQMAGLAPLFAETAEEREDIGRETAIGAVGGTPEQRAEAAGRLGRRRQSRTARFEGGGGAAGGGAGATGLGTAR